MTVSSGPRADRVQSGWPRGFPRPCLLLLIAERPAHGYDLLERLAELEAPAIDAGTLYRTLRAMEREGLVESRWDVASAGPARRVYRITRVGRAELATWTDLMADSQRAITGYLQRYASLTRSAARTQAQRTGNARPANARD